MVRVLVTDSTYKHALAATRALSRQGFEVQTIGEARGQASISCSTGKHHQLGFESQLSFVRNVNGVVQAEKISALLPIGARSVAALASHRLSLYEPVGLALPNKETLELALNKGGLLTFAKEVGLTCPPTWTFHSRRDLINGLSALPPPLVVKSASELHKFGPIYLDTEDSKARFLEFGVPDGIFESSYLLVQSQVRGPGVGFFALYQNGVCKRMFMHERLREMPATGGSSWAARGMYSTKLADQGLRLLDSLNWHGPAMVEFKKDSSCEEQYSLMELNPKFWGSLDLAIESGVDFASDTVRVALGEEIETRLDFDPTKFFVWPLENLREYIKDKELHQKRYRTNIKLADLLPSIHQLLGPTISHVHGIFSSTILSTLLFWWRKHTPRDFISRVVGQVFGLPLREHCRITDNLWVGSRPSPLGRALLQFKGFDLRVSLLETNSKFEKQALPELLEMPMEEFSPFPSPLLYKYGLEVLKELQSGRKIFLHCREGVGRAPGLAIAILLLGGKDLEDATRTVGSGRKVISLNKNQASSLVEFEEYIRRMRQT